MPCASKNRGNSSYADPRTRAPLCVQWARCRKIGSASKAKFGLFILRRESRMNTCIEELGNTVAPAGTIHSVAGPAVPVYVIIMIVVRMFEDLF
jgi:hypothetical protein